MKTKIFKLLGTLKVLGLTALIAFSISSCSTDDGTTAETSMSNKVSEDSASTARSATAPGNSSIAEIAVNGGFNELVSALVYVDSELNTGLVDLFANGNDQYTVFAPTDQAFKNLYATLKINNIKDLPAPLVRDVLLYHVTDGRRAANSVVPKNGMRQITTLLDSQFSVTSNGSIVAINSNATITTANISASNGIIHVVDAVLLPKLN